MRCARDLTLPLALQGCAASVGIAAPIDVFIPTPPQIEPARLHAGGVARGPEVSSVCDVQVGDSVAEVEQRLGGRTVEAPREEFAELFDRTRDPALAIALTLGFDRVVVVAGDRTPVFRAYVAGDTIRMMSFVADAEEDRAPSASLSRRCSMNHSADPIEDACGAGYLSIDSRPESYHYFKQGYSIRVTAGRISEIHVYPKLTDAEIAAVQVSLAAP
jgi:hypothetical protein